MNLSRDPLPQVFDKGLDVWIAGFTFKPWIEAEVIRVDPLYIGPTCERDEETIL